MNWLVPRRCQWSQVMFVSTQPGESVLFVFVRHPLKMVKHGKPWIAIAVYHLIF